MSDKNKFWLCGEFHNFGNGDLSRPWVEKSDECPDTPVQHPDNCMCCHGGKDEAPYPFNMSARVIAGPFSNYVEAWDEFARLYPDG